MRNFVIASTAAAAIVASTFPVEDSPELSAEIAIQASLDQFRETKTDVCENCRGTGKIGDGRVVYDCPVCGGDGKTECESCQLR